jgi:hypothetical protein
VHIAPGAQESSGSTLTVQPAAISGFASAEASFKVRLDLDFAKNRGSDLHTDSLGSVSTRDI